jgi:hypothetical protein
VLSLSRLAAPTLLALCFGAAPASALAADAYEPNNTQAAAAGPLVDARSYAGDIASAEDRDWFQFIAGAAGTVTVAASNDTPKGCFGPEYFVFDAAGARVAKAHPASGRSESVTFTAPGAGKYFLRVTPYYIEPCLPEETTYRFTVSGGLVERLPSAPGGTVTPPASNGTPSGGSPTKPSTSTPGGSSSSTAKALLSPALKLVRTSLRAGKLRASGTVASGARGGKVRITVTRRVGKKTLSVRKTVTVGAGGKWSLLASVPRSAARVTVDVAYVADKAYKAQTARKTVKRSAS